MEIQWKKTAGKTGASKTTVFRILKENDVTDLKAKNGRKQKLSKRLKTSIIKNFENNQHNTASDAVKWIKKILGLHIKIMIFLIGNKLFFLMNQNLICTDLMEITEFGVKKKTC